MRELQQLHLVRYLSLKYRDTHIGGTERSNPLMVFDALLVWEHSCAVAAQVHAVTEGQDRVEFEFLWKTMSCTDSQRRVYTALI